MPPMETAPKMPYNGAADGVLDSASRVRGQPIDYAIMVGLLPADSCGRNLVWSAAEDDQRFLLLAGSGFSWWLIAFSLIATTVGSYSFVKYSLMGYKYGLASSQTYLNDWIWFPLLAFGWLPILYFSTCHLDS